MNRVDLLGRLVKDPELKQTQNGVAVLSFSLAVERKFKDHQTGVRGADFINCVAWRQTADFIARYFRKGQKMAVCGRIETRTYDAQDGTKRYVTEVIVEEAHFCEHREESSYPPIPSNAPKDRPEQKPHQERMDMQTGFPEVEEDELPF